MNRKKKSEVLLFQTQIDVTVTEGVSSHFLPHDIACISFCPISISYILASTYDCWRFLCQALFPSVKWYKTRRSHAYIQPTEGCASTS